MTLYDEFLKTKAISAIPTGREIDLSDIHPSLFDFQKQLVRYSVRKGRAALFCATGTGKSRMQIEYARLTQERALLISPLGVARQTVREGAAIGVPIVYARHQSEASRTGLTITNYEMLHQFDPDQFGCVVLDESAILRNFEGATRNQLIRMFRHTPYRLACTAVAAPNDIVELANHAEFLGVMSRVDMLASFFVHDDDGWRLKGHARQPFYRWLASWGMSLKRPGDLGYSNAGYILPKLSIYPVIARTGPGGVKGIADRSRVRRLTMEARVQETINAIESEHSEQWIVWCGLNEEGRAIHDLLPDSVLIEGSDSPDKKVERLDRFISGSAQVLITKTKIFGHGLNLQFCGRQVFCGLSDSFDAYHQAIRRSWRFGRKEPVDIYIVLSEQERSIYENVLRKEREFEALTDELVKHVQEYEKAELATGARYDDVPHDMTMEVPEWLRSM